MLRLAQCLVQYYTRGPHPLTSKGMSAAAPRLGPRIGVNGPTSEYADSISEITAHYTMLYSSATLLELRQVLTRARFSEYADIEDAQSLLIKFAEIEEIVMSDEEVRARRDPNDDKFLELAICGDADCIITADRERSTLQPFRRISIITTCDFMS